MQKSQLPVTPEKDTENEEWISKEIQDQFQNKISRYNKIEKQCLHLIGEFLQSYGFQNTLATFAKESEELGFELTVPTGKERIKKETLEEILSHFISRDVKQFFKVWESHIPETIQHGIEYKKLTFYMHVHFAVLPLRTTDSDKLLGKEGEPENGGMEALRQFLETKGTEFSAEPEFLPYYALPFVNNPFQHPSFQELFTEKWMKQLTDNLQQFLFDYTWGNTVAPRLMLIEKNGLYNTESQLSPKMHSLEANTAYKQLKRRYQKLHKDHHNLIGVAAELTEALENSVKGQAVDLKSTLNNCTNIFPDLFSHANQNEDIESELSPEEIIKRSIAQTKEDHANNMGFDLDFRKIKQHLTSGSIKTKLLLFQALRWRITRSAPEDRDCVANSYLRHDILSLHPGSASSSHKNDSLLLAAHFAPPHAATPHPLQQAAARLVNTLASLRCGRDYLSSAGFGLIRILVSALHGDKGIKLDPFSKDMVVATLQKLSLRHRQRIGMIEAGLVEWLIQHLVAEGLDMKSYALEYSTALLMNLCLHHRAKERCVSQAKVILQLLTTLLGTEVKQAIPYVNGTLYSLLAHPNINQEAKHMGLCGVLEFYLKNSEGEMYRQLEYILRLHRGDCQPDSSAASDEENADDDTEEVDLLEEELDSDDPVRSLNGDLQGEELLKQQYRLLFPYHSVVHPSTSQPQQQTGELLVRPTTPHTTSRDSRMSSRLQYSRINMAALKPKAENISEQKPEELMLESFDSEIGKDEDEDEEETVVIIGDMPTTSEYSATENSNAGLESDELGDLPPTPVQTSKGGSDTAKETTQPQEAKQQCEDGEDEYAKAFSSRPRIPRTPTFQANNNSELVQPW